MRSLFVLILIMALEGSASAQIVPLQNGEPVLGRVAAALEPGSAVLSATQYTIDVPAGATELAVTLFAVPTTLDIDLQVRFGQPVAVEGGGDILSDHFSETVGSGSEVVVVTPQSAPPLQAGTYYIGVVNYETQEVLFSLTAAHDAESATTTPTATPTVEASGTPTPTPTLTSTPSATLTPTASPTQTAPPVSSPTPTPDPTTQLMEQADLDGNGEIDARDLLLLQSVWGLELSP